MTPPADLHPAFELPRHAAATAALRPGAWFEVLSHRATRGGIEDEFVVDVVPLAPGLAPTAADLLHTTPVGTGWRQSVGRYGYYVIPFRSGGVFGVCAGVEEVVPHPTRGAYPICHGFGFRTATPEESTTAAGAIRRLAAAVGGLLPSPPETLPPSGEVVRPAADDPAGDAVLLEIAAAHLGRGRPFFLRTRLLAESLHPRLVADALMLDPPLGPLLRDPAHALIGRPSKSGDEPAPASWAQLFHFSLRWLDLLAGPLRLAARSARKSPPPPPALP